MASSDREEEALRSVALHNSRAILLAHERAEAALVQAKDALEQRTRELSQSLSLMTATLESTADGILVTGPDGRIRTFNEMFLEIWRHSRQTVEGATHLDLTRKVKHWFADPVGFENRVAEIYSVPALEVLDTLQLADGRVFERFSRPQYVDMKMVGRVWSYRDVTARTRIEEAVREEARVLDLLNRTGATIASTLNVSTLLQTVADAATQLSGADFGGFMYRASGESSDAVVLYSRSAGPRAALEPSRSSRALPEFGGAAVRCDDILLDERCAGWVAQLGKPDDQGPVRSFLAVPVALRGGDRVGALFIGHSQVGAFTERDERLVTGIAAQSCIALDNARLYEEARRVAVERERLIDAERAARAELSRIDRLKDEFLATLSHELRTPLTSILGWAKILLKKKADPETLNRGLEAIERNAVGQARLIEDLLDMNRIISGKVRLEVQPIEIASVAEAAVEAVRPSAQAKAIHLTKLFDPAVGPAYGDPNRLQQVLWNLLTNAVKFTPHGGTVEVAVRAADAHFEVSVSDSGAGISPEFLPHVFDRFRQEDSSATRSSGGLGLGLSIVKQLVELHGGTVRAHSDGEGRGARFVMRLPAGQASAGFASERPPANGPAAMPRVDVSLRELKVLVVDDETDTRELIGQVLRDCGAQVLTASSAAEALASFQRHRPHLLLSDIGMPGRDGYQLIGDIRRLAAHNGGDTPAIALTAFARSEDRTRAMLAGYQVHLSKPVEPHELVATVASITGRMNAPGPA
jgi:signal transduction histidine kinase/ActR/RegA family two-component response regulator